MNRPALSLLLLFAAAYALPAANEKLDLFHRFLVTYSAYRYDKVVHGTVVKVTPDGYRKNGEVWHLLTIEVKAGIKQLPARGREYLLFSKNEFSFTPGEEYLFFSTARGKLSFLDPPVRIEGTRARLDEKTYPLAAVLGWAREATAGTLGAYLQNNRQFLSPKRVRDRQAGFVLKMRQKELLLLYRINQRCDLQELVSFLLELGHTRIMLKKYPEAKNAFLYVKEKYRVTPLVTLMAERGLALLLWYDNNPKAAIARFVELLKDPAGDRGYRATLRLDLARLYETGKQYPQALAQYRLAAGEFPARHQERAFALFNIGELLLQQGDKAAAMVSFRESYTLFHAHLAAAFKKEGARFPAWYFALQRRLGGKG